MGKSRPQLSLLITAAGVAVLLVWFARTYVQTRLARSAERLAEQTAAIVQLTRERERLSALVADQSRLGTGSTEEPSVELARLRGQADELRRQLNELVNAGPSSLELPSAPAPARSVARELSGIEIVVSDAASPEYKHELYKIGASSPRFGPWNIDARKDAQNLGHALRSFARAHDGEIPATFEEAAGHLFKEYRPPNAAEYEIIFRGSLNDVTNIPSQAIALVREREPWPTPSGKLGRLYVMANGAVRIVEADDHFQSWEAEHVVAPR